MPTKRQALLLPKYPRLVYDFDFTRPKLDPRLTFTRTSGDNCYYIGPSGLAELVAPGVPRFEHDPVTKQCLGLLIEPQTNNRLAASNAVDNNGGGGTGGAIVQNQVGADGVANSAWTVTEQSSAAANQYVRVGQSVGVALQNSTKYIAEIYIKQGTATKFQMSISGAWGAGTEYANFSLVGDGSVLAQGGGASEARVRRYGNGFLRCTFAWTPTAVINVGTAGGVLAVFIQNDTDGRIPFYQGTGQTLIIWHAQVEQAEISGLIPTPQSTGLRASETLTMVPTINLFNGFREYSMYMEIMYRESTLINLCAGFRFNDVSSTNGSQITMRGSSTNVSVFFGGPSTSLTDNYTAVPGQIIKHAHSAKGKGSVAGAGRGNLLGPAVAFADFATTPFTQITATGGYGIFRKLKIWNGQLPMGAMAAMTSG